MYNQDQDQDTDPGVECVSLCCSSGDETDSTKATTPLKM